MDQINHQNTSQANIRTSYSPGYGGNRRAAYAKPKSGQRNNSPALNLLQRLDAIDERRQYKPSLLELFDRMDASSINSLNRE